MVQRVFSVLFVDEHNAVRSIMAEVILYQLGRGRFRTHSAGLTPQAEIHPLTLRALELAGQGYRLEGLHPKPMQSFAESAAQPMDFVLTLSDVLLSTGMPEWPGTPVQAHWGCDEPLQLAQRMGWTGPQLIRAFNQVYVQLLTRLRIFASLPPARLQQMTQQARLTPGQWTLSGPSALGTPDQPPLQQTG